MKTKIFAALLLVCAVSAGLFVASGGRSGAIPGDLRDAPADFSSISMQAIADQDVPLPEAGQVQTQRYNVQPVAIYGQNTLNDYYKVDKSLQQLANSVVALMDKSALVYDAASGMYKAPALTTVNQRMGLSGGATFSGQKSLSFCSGALVSENLVLTAGHCVNNNPADPHYFDKIYVVFGWKQTGAGSYNTTFSRDQVYEADRLLVHKLDGAIGDMDSYRDFAMISLSRAVPGRSPLTIERSRGEGLAVGAYVFASGYPMGMSVKVTDPGDATIQAIGRHGYATDLDAFGGSSGGPVFDSATRRIAGVLITANAKQFKYTTRRDISLRYRVDAAPAAKLSLVEEAGGKVLVVPQGIFAGVSNTLQAAGCRVDSGAAVITFPSGYSYYDSESGLMNELISLVGTGQDVYGEPVQLPAYEGIGTGVQKIEAAIEVFTPFTAEETRKCELIRSKIRKGAVIDPTYMMLYKAAKCDSRTAV